MADKKKPIKQCRVKADTCFKWHCLGKLFGLSLEDIGLMYLVSQIQDDEKNIRYGLIENEILDMYKTTEAEWLALHSAKMKNDPLYRIAFSDLNGQRKATTNHYKAEVKRREDYNKRVAQQNGTDDNESGEIQENVVTSDEVEEQQAGEKKNTSEVINDTRKSLYRKEPFGPGHGIRALQFPDGEIIYAHYEKCNEANVITQEEFLEHVEMSDDKDLVKDIIYENNKQGWKPEEAEEGPF